MARAGAIIIKDSKVALIKRLRDGLTYYLFPGGQIEDGETIAEACIREIKEELGYEIIPKEIAIEVVFNDNRQYYFTCEIIGGEFGKGTGPEYDGSYPTSNGTYEPVWIDINDIDMYDIRPIEVVEYLKKIRWNE